MHFSGMARHYSELRVWKLADALRVDVFSLTSRPAFAKDLKAKGQADDAISSVCRNIAEGFGCGTHAEFARFLEYSRRSINEVQDAMRGAHLQNYVNAEEVDESGDSFHASVPR
jgi:four helix bundle protein